MIDENKTSTSQLHIGELLRSTYLFEIVPDTSKILVTDVRVPMHVLIRSLFEYKKSFAALWSDALRQYIGIVDATTLADFLLWFYDQDPDVLLPNRTGFPSPELFAEYERSMYEQARLEAIAAGHPPPPLQTDLTPVDASVVALEDVTVAQFLDLSGTPLHLPTIPAVTSCMDALSVLLNSGGSLAAVWNEELATPLSFVSIWTLCIKIMLSLRGSFIELQQCIVNDLSLLKGPHQQQNLITLSYMMPLHAAISLLRRHSISAAPIVSHTTGAFVCLFSISLHIPLFLASALGRSRLVAPDPDPLAEPIDLDEPVGLVLWRLGFSPSLEEVNAADSQLLFTPVHNQQVVASGDQKTENEKENVNIILSPLPLTLDFPIHQSHLSNSAFHPPDAIEVPPLLCFGPAPSLTTAIVPTSNNVQQTILCNYGKKRVSPTASSPTASTAPSLAELASPFGPNPFFGLNELHTETLLETSQNHTVILQGSDLQSFFSTQHNNNISNNNNINLNFRMSTNHQSTSGDFLAHPHPFSQHHQHTTTTTPTSKQQQITTGGASTNTSSAFVPPTSFHLSPATAAVNDSVNKTNIPKYSPAVVLQPPFPKKIGSQVQISDLLSPAAPSGMLSPIPHLESNTATTMVGTSSSLPSIPGAISMVNNISSPNINFGNNNNEKFHSEILHAALSTGASVPSEVFTSDVTLQDALLHVLLSDAHRLVLCNPVTRAPFAIVAPTDICRFFIQKSADDFNCNDLGNNNIIMSNNNNNNNNTSNGTDSMHHHQSNNINSFSGGGAANITESGFHTPSSVQLPHHQRGTSTRVAESTNVTPANHNNHANHQHLPPTHILSPVKGPQPTSKGASSPRSVVSSNNKNVQHSNSNNIVSAGQNISGTGGFPPPSIGSKKSYHEVLLQYADRADANTWGG